MGFMIAFHIHTHTTPYRIPISYDEQSVFSGWCVYALHHSPSAIPTLLNFDQAIEDFQIALMINPSNLTAQQHEVKQKEFYQSFFNKTS